MVTEFDPTIVRPQDRYPQWMEVVGQVFCRANGRRGDDRPFEARLLRCPLGVVDVSDLSCNAMRYDRARQDQCLDQRDDFLVSLLLQGQGQLDQQGRAARQEPGQMVLYDAARPYVYTFPGSYRLLLLRIPRRAMLSRLPEAERMTAVAIGTGTPLGNLAANMIQGTASLALPTSATASAKVGSSLMDVVSAAIEMELSAHEEQHDRQSTLLKRAKDYILTHLDDPQLDIEVIAKAAYVSPRTLSRAFATEGTTVARWLWNERLAAGHAALTEGRAVQVGELAMSCGFASGSHFSRLFKATYGVLPHTLLSGSARAH